MLAPGSVVRALAASIFSLYHNNIFSFLVVNATANYSMDRVEEEILCI
jgi:hypothetical protein